jgi:ribosomal protein S27E
MAYLTCPDCRMPNSMSDDSANFTCMSCFAQVIFQTCEGCGYRQAIPSRWQTAFTCGKCDRKVDIPRTRSYALATKARQVEGYGHSYPKML